MGGCDFFVCFRVVAHEPTFKKTPQLRSGRYIVYLGHIAGHHVHLLVEFEAPAMILDSSSERQAPTESISVSPADEASCAVVQSLSSLDSGSRFR